MLAAAGCDLMFMPDVAEIYPHGAEHATRVEVPELSEHPRRRVPARALRGRQHDRRQAVPHRRAGHRGVRREGFPAAHDHPPHGRGPVHAGARSSARRRCASRRAGDELAQSVPDGRGAQARAGIYAAAGARMRWHAVAGSCSQAGARRAPASGMDTRGADARRSKPPASGATTSRCARRARLAARLIDRTRRRSRRADGGALGQARGSSTTCRSRASAALTGVARQRPLHVLAHQRRRILAPRSQCRERLRRRRRIARAPPRYCATSARSRCGRSPSPRMRSSNCCLGPARTARQRGASRPWRTLKSGCAAARANLFQGHTSWQSSQP